jgi:hypothetical protein
MELIYLCKKCAKEKILPTTEYHDKCIEELEDKGNWVLQGNPGIVEHFEPFQFTRRKIPLSSSLAPGVLIIQPLPKHATDAIFLNDCGALCRVNLAEGKVHTITTLTNDQIRLDGIISMVLSHDHTLAAVTSRSSYQQAPFNSGVVIDLKSGQSLISLHCGDYHVEQAPFPVCFIIHDGKTIMVHATDWDRLDVTNPKTGQCLTERDFSSISDNEDFFDQSVGTEWCGELAVSPNMQRIATIGWIWHPVGIAFSWSAKDWLEKNVWEADNGASKRSYCIWNYFWHSPFFWYDDSTLCIWGACDLQTNHDIPKDSAVLYNADTEQVIRIFAGPTGDVFYYDHYLFSGLPDKDGISIWDIETGTLLYKQSEITPIAYHPGTREFIEIEKTGWYGWHWQKIDGDQQVID